MKRYLIIFLTFILCVFAVGCDSGREKELSLGLGFVPSVENAANGNLEFDAVVAAVVTDSKGKITACKIDAIQNKILIDNGKIDSNAYSETFKTKRELKEKYGMKAASEIKKEWYEQADYFSNYVVGMTVQQVSTIATEKRNDGGFVAKDSALSAGCTIDVSDFIKAIVEACNDKYAKTFKGDDYKIGIAAVSKFDASSKEAQIGENGVAKFESSICALAVDSDHNTLAAIIDSAEPEIPFSADGSVQSVDVGKLKSKRELGSLYGMASVSPIKKEWYEQSAALENYIAGKDSVGINSIRTENKDGKIVSAEPQLTAGCTIDISMLLESAKKAIESVK